MISRVLMTADTVGGVWSYAMELSRALAQRRVEVVLASMGRRPSVEQTHEVERIPGLRLFSSEHKLEWMSDPWADVARSGEWLMGIAERVRPDVVHVNGYAHAALPFAAPKISVAHSCVLSWWRAVKGEDAPADDWSRYAEEATKGLRAADQVIAPSESMLKEAERHYGPFRSSRVIYNARTPQAFPPKEKIPFVLTAGRFWDEGKNLAALEAASPSVDWPIYVAGEQFQNAGHRAQPAHGKLRLLGNLAPRYLAFWYGRAAIYCLPAKYEPFGLSVLEAALAGCALVLGDIPSLREIWGDAAVYVRPEDPEQIAYALNRLARDPDRLIDMARRAQFRAMQYAPDRMADEYMEVYTGLVQPREAVEQTV